MQKYVALVKSIAVRDGQVCLSENTELLEGNWQDFESAEVFLGIYEGTQKEALKAAADNWEVPESNIRLVEIET